MELQFKNVSKDYGQVLAVDHVTYIRAAGSERGGEDNSDENAVHRDKSHRRQDFVEWQRYLPAGGIVQRNTRLSAAELRFLSGSVGL